MDDRDRQLLNRLQSNFPLTSTPYQFLGEELGISEAEVLERINRLKEQGIIRRIGASFDSGGLGYVSSLIALKVPEEELAKVASIINSYPGVTHNYQRNHPCNLWFTLIAPSSAELANTLKEIQTRIGDLPYLNLPARRVFKIKAQFSF